MAAALAHRTWVQSNCETYIQGLAAETRLQGTDAVLASIDQGIALNRSIHERDCFNLNPATNNLNPATNVMNPRAEAALASRLGSRPSLGYPGEYEMGLEGVERVEVITAELAAEIFNARFAEIRVPSGAIADLYAFVLAAKPGDRIIVPPPRSADTSHTTSQAAPDAMASKSTRPPWIRTATPSTSRRCASKPGVFAPS